MAEFLGPPSSAGERSDDRDRPGYPGEKKAHGPPVGGIAVFHTVSDKEQNDRREGRSDTEGQHRILDQKDGYDDGDDGEKGDYEAPERTEGHRPTVPGHSFRALGPAFEDLLADHTLVFRQQGVERGSGEGLLQILYRFLAVTAFAGRIDDPGVVLLAERIDQIEDDRVYGPQVAFMPIIVIARWVADP